MCKLCSPIKVTERIPFTLKALDVKQVLDCKVQGRGRSAEYQMWKPLYENMRDLGHSGLEGTLVQPFPGLLGNVHRSLKHACVWCAANTPLRHLL